MRVDQFPIIDLADLTEDTLIPTQRVSSTLSPAPKQFSLLNLAFWIKDFVFAYLFFRRQELTVATGVSPVIAIADGEMLTHVMVKSPSAATLKIGTSVGGTQVIEDEAIPANTYVSIARNYAATGGQNLHISGLPTGATVKAYFFT